MFFSRTFFYIYAIKNPVQDRVKGKGKGRTLDIAPRVDMATTKALRYTARTKQRRTYLPYTFQAVAGTHLPTTRGWRVE